ncbi:MAG: hypothetical protein WBW71_00115, partial [Bacteroidota bacterium]
MTSNPQNTPLSSPSGTPDKAAAKQCLLAADRFLKESRFHEARTEIEKAKKFDPANVYVVAFLDRINYFEAQKKKEASPVPLAAVTQPPSAAPLPGATPPRVSTAPAVPPRAAVPPPGIKPTPVVGSPPPKPVAQPVPASPPQPVAVSSVNPPPATTPPPAMTREVPPEPVPTPAEQKAMEATLEEMKRQIQMLSHSLEQEKKAREEMTNQQLDSNVRQLRHSMEKAWLNGAPSDIEVEELHKLALSLSIPENVEQSLRREVKLKMYSNAVKEVIAKRQLLRSSSSTFEWLRKVYQVTMEEYLEYETKFLLDLVADQYKGTVLYVSPNVKTK